MQRSGRGRVGLLVLLVITLLAAACGAAAPTGSDSAADATGANTLEMTDVSMRFQWVPQWQFAGYIVAEVNGYYDEAGLNVTLNAGGPDFPTKQLVASGAEQFGTAWADSMYLSQQQGVDLVALATLFQTNPSAYMVHRDAGIDGPEDFVGRRVAVFYGGGVETEYRGMLRLAGVDRDQIEEVPGEFSLDLFLRRDVDVWPVYATDQPRTARELGAEIDLIFARDYGVVMMGDVLFATREFIEEHPNTVRAFVHASLRGWQWAVNNVDETISLIAEYNDQADPEQLAFEAEQTIPLLTYGAGENCIGWNNQKTWQQEQELLLELDILEEPIPFEQVTENRFVAEYYAEQDIACATE